MAQLLDQLKVLASIHSIARCTVSCIFILLTQFTLSLVPRFFSDSSFLVQLSLSGFVLLLVAGSGRWYRRIFRIYASAPALVFFNILFIWCFYAAIVREAISSVMDVLFNGEVAMLVIGLCSILLRDPGLVTHDASGSEKLVENSGVGVDPQNATNSHSLNRVRYCKSCKVHVKGFDHHCPAFGSCIGQNNYALFMVLLVGFITTESTYLVSTTQFVRKSLNTDRNQSENDLARDLATSTMLFAILQLLWQVVFLIWHISCVCINLKTDEWIQWRKYPEFQFVYCEPGENFTRMRLRNPYDKGILQNIKDFLSSRG